MLSWDCPFKFREPQVYSPLILRFFIRGANRGKRMLALLR